jgi:hypothetical protein
MRHMSRVNTNVCRFRFINVIKKRPFGRPRCRREDNIKINLNETGYEDV